jgi:hypothetical protein
VIPRCVSIPSSYTHSTLFVVRTPQIHIPTCTYRTRFFVAAELDTYHMMQSKTKTIGLLLVLGGQGSGPDWGDFTPCMTLLAPQCLTSHSTSAGAVWESS